MMCCRAFIWAWVVLGPALALEAQFIQVDPAESLPAPKALTPIRSLQSLGLDIGVSPGELPTDVPALPLGEIRAEHERERTPVSVHWEASNLAHRPLYFEDIGLERHGHTLAPLLQPAISGGRFYAGILFLPYKLAAQRPRQMHYALGYYRPGTSAPRYIYRLPRDPSAMFFQGAAATGLVFLIP